MKIFKCRIVTLSASTRELRTHLVAIQGAQRDRRTYISAAGVAFCVRGPRRGAIRLQRDLGIVGQRVPSINKEKCRSCGKCQVELECPMKAAALRDGELTIDRTICNNCGRCLTKCPFHSIENEETL